MAGVQVDKDATTCAPGSGQCAVLEMSSYRLYEANTLLSIRLVDPTPWKGVEGNACNGDGDVTDVGRCASATACTTDAACGDGVCIGGVCAASVRACTTNADCTSPGETCQADAGTADDRDCNNNGIDDDGNGYADDCHGIDAVNHDSDPLDDHFQDIS